MKVYEYRTKLIPLEKYTFFYVIMIITAPPPRLSYLLLALPSLRLLPKHSYTAGGNMNPLGEEPSTGFPANPTQ
jgi:hypothetical protein